MATFTLSGLDHEYDRDLHHVNMYSTSHKDTKRHSVFIGSGIAIGITRFSRSALGRGGCRNLFPGKDGEIRGIFWGER